MAQEFAIPAGAGEKMLTGTAAFGTGLSMSLITRQWPASGMIGSILLGGVGLLGSLLTRGWMAEGLEGIGAGGLAVLGSSIAWLPQATTTGKGRPLTKEIQKGEQTIILQLKGGPATATGELAAKAKAAILEF